MTDLVFDHPDVSCWVIENAGCEGDFVPSNVTSIGIVRDKDVFPREVLGGVIYHSYTGAGGSVQIHSAGNERNWATRDFLWAIFDYPFNQLHVNRVIGQVPSDNVRALKIDMMLGFRIETVVRGVYPDADCLVMALERENCRWLKRRPRHIQAGILNVMPTYAE